MRKILISLLMASAAVTPAIAHAQDSAAERRAEREKARADRQAERDAKANARESRDDRAAARENRAAAREERAVQQQQVQQPAANADARRNAVRDRQQQVQIDRSTANEVRRGDRQDRQDRREQLANQRQDQREQRAEQRQDNREARQARYQQIREARRNAGPPPVSRNPQPNTQPPPPITRRPTAPVNWNNNWRNSSRYNWYDWRRKNRWLFNLGYYYDPFGWNYQPYSIGWRMWPGYYNSDRYWLNDPWQYRLPYAPPGTRWIRYYDDAILVDTWNGQVVDVIYDFFW